jgi:hypothetical protein
MVIHAAGVVIHHFPAIIDSVSAIIHDAITITHDAGIAVHQHNNVSHRARRTGGGFRGRPSVFDGNCLRMMIAPPWMTTLASWLTSPAS